ncbi:MAG TPA: hypothetical protein VGL86_12750 [Polyangia bacterium]|jgi:hypothetical protein
MAAGRSGAALALALVGVVGGCGGASNDPAADAILRLSNAQFHRGKPPAPGDGPLVQQLTTMPASVIRRGATDAVTGFVDRAASSVIIWLDGDVGYWIVQPGAIEVTELGQLAFGAPATYPNNLASGSYTLHAMASDMTGTRGPVVDLALHTEDVAQTDTLLVSLGWDTESDLDLHLVTPDGTEVWANKINSEPLPQPGDNSDPNGYKNGGILDFDSNANCVIDGRRLENVFWTVPPPSGHYIVRVDTWSLCAESWANWRVDVTLNGQSLGNAFGYSRPTDVELPHGIGAGVTALAFDIP